MSEENEQGDDNQKDASEADEFQFYFSFTKPLVLELPSSEDRAVAAAWVQKLEAEPESEEEKEQRLNYLKLLLFVLQRGRLSGIFKKQPPSGPLQPFPQGFSLLDMGNWMLDQDDGQACGGGDARSLPYTVELSNDLREFAASQEVPNFGIQMYYAWSSDEPVHKWESFDEEKFPQFILDKIKQLKETKSDEKSYVVKNGCLTKKKGCDIGLQDKFSKKKVKSPQEIERSQGRSFHTYMGLVGRMGNFNDKCDDDPEKFQRQDPRKVKCQRRNVPPKRCPGNGGEAEEMAPEEEFDTFVTGLGGLNVPNKSCACPNPCHHQQSRPDFQPKGGPQSFENSQGACRNISVRGDVENTQYSVPVNKPENPRRPMRETSACPDIEMPEMMPQQKCPSPRSRNNSPGRNMECPPPMSEGASGRCQKKAGVCICSSLCSCPCPRGKPQKATSNANSVERACSPEPSRNQRCPPQSPRSPACPPQPSRSQACSPEPPRSPMCPPNSRSPRQESGCSADGYRAPYNSLRSFENNAMSNSTMSDLSPIRSAGGMKYGVPEIVHCYDSRNPDPSLAPKLEKQWTQAARGFNRDLDVDFKNYISRDQGGTSRQTCSPNARRANFAPQAQSTPINQRSYHQSERSGNRCLPLSRPEISGAESNPCDYPNPEDAQPPCPPRGRQQASYEQQQLQQSPLECADKAPPSRRTSDPCRAPPSIRAPDPCRAPPPMRASDPCGVPQRMLTDPCRAPPPTRASDPCGAPQRMRSPDTYRAAPPMRAPDPCGAPPPMRASDPCGAPAPMRASDPCGAPPPMRASDPCGAPQRMRASDPCRAPPPMRASDPCRAPPPMRAADPCGAPPPMRASDPCGLRQKPDAYNKKCPPTGVNKQKNASPFAVSNDTGRLANMVNVLQGLKQRTEGQRDKYETVGVRRSPPPNDAACYPGNVQAQPKSPCPPKARPQQIGFDEGANGGEVNSPRNGRPAQQMYYSPQSKPAQAFSPVSQRGANASNKVCPTQQQAPQRSPQQMRPPQPPSPDCYPMSSISYEDADACPEEEDFDCASYEGMDIDVPAPPAPQNMSRSKAQPLAAQAGRRQSPAQECPKPMPLKECEQPWNLEGFNGDNTMELLNDCDYWSNIGPRGSPRGGMNQSDVNEGYIDAPLDFSGVRDYSVCEGNSKSFALMDISWPPVDGPSSQIPCTSRQSPRQQNATPVEDVIPFLRQGNKGEQCQQETFSPAQDDYDDTDDTCATFNVMPEEDCTEQNFMSMASDAQEAAIEGPEECQDSNDPKWATMPHIYLDQRYPYSPDLGTQGQPLNSRDPQCQPQFSPQNRGYQQ